MLNSYIVHCNFQIVHLTSKSVVGGLDPGPLNLLVNLCKDLMEVQVMKVTFMQLCVNIVILPLLPCQLWLSSG